MGQEAGERSEGRRPPVSARAPDLTSGRRSTGSSGPAAPRPRRGRGRGRSQGPGGRGKRPWAQGAARLGSRRRHETPRGSCTSASAGGVACSYVTSGGNGKCESPGRSRGLMLPIPSRPRCQATPASCRSWAVGGLQVRVPSASAQQSASEGRKGFHSGTFKSCTQRKSRKRVRSRGELPHVGAPARLCRASPAALRACVPGNPHAPGPSVPFSG